MIDYECVAEIIIEALDLITESGVFTDMKGETRLNISSSTHLGEQDICSIVIDSNDDVRWGIISSETISKINDGVDAYLDQQKREMEEANEE